MPTARSKQKEPDIDSMFGNAAEMAALAQKSFHTAKRKAIKENDRLGVPSYGAKNGRITVRQAKKSTGPA